MTPGHAKSQPPQTELHIIPDDTEVISPKSHTYGGILFNVPLVYGYNTRARHLKGHNLMANHVAKIPPPRQIPNPSPTNTTVNRTGEELVHTKRTTGEVKIQPVLMNAFIFPDT